MSILTHPTCQCENRLPIIHDEFITLAKEVMFLAMCICLSVYKITKKNYGCILMKFSDDGTRNRLFTFGLIQITTSGSMNF